MWDLCLYQHSFTFFHKKAKNVIHYTEKKAIEIQNFTAKKTWANLYQRVWICAQTPTTHMELQKSCLQVWMTHNAVMLPCLTITVVEYTALKNISWERKWLFRTAQTIELDAEDVNLRMSLEAFLKFSLNFHLKLSNSWTHFLNSLWGVLRSS